MSAAGALVFNLNKCLIFTNISIISRSARMKLPASVGMKKSKAIENMVGELGLETQPPCTEEICTEFNEIRSVRVVLMSHPLTLMLMNPCPRSDMVLLYELKNALTASEFELSSLQLQYEALVPGKSLSLPQQLMTSNTRLGEIRSDSEF